MRRFAFILVLLFRILRARGPLQSRQRNGAGIFSFDLARRSADL